MKRMRSYKDGPTAIEDRFVAFIDILGFGDLVRRMTSGELELFKTIKKMLESILKHETRTYNSVVQALAFRTLQMTSFSDYVVISDLTDEYFNVLLAAQELYMRLLLEGILCRGAIARGPIYHSGRIIFGEGLILAYKLESRAAIYPRIIVTDEVQQKFAESDVQSDDIDIKSSQMLARDHDGLWFINPFGYPRGWLAYRQGEDPEEVTQRKLERIRARIIDGLTHAQQQSISHLDRVAKHRWLVRQFNAALAVEGRTKPLPIDI